MTMFYSFFRIAWRNLWKNKLFSFINVFGLASGLLVCLLAMIGIKGAFDYDSIHPHPERTYRILTDLVTQDNDNRSFATSPLPLADELKQKYPFVEEVTRVIRNNGDFSTGTKQLPVLYSVVDAGFFRIFGFRLEKGQPAVAPKTIVLTQETAQRFFGSANPIGKVLTHHDLGALTVTGVLRESAAKTHLHFDVLVSVATLSGPAWQQALADWRNYSQGYTYVMVKPGMATDALAKVLPELSNRATNGLRFASEKGYTLRSQPLTKLSPAREELMNATYEPTIGKLETELGVGLLTLLLAAFNYINLTLARSLSRAREVGIRKVAGALRWQLMAQFMAESVVLSLFGLSMAYGMLQLIKPMPFVQQWLIGGVEWESNVGVWFIFVTFSVLTGLLAGLLPAKVLTQFQPAQVLRSQTGLRVFRGITLRKSLIIAQFAISLFAMITLLSMARQQHYMGHTDYGFDRSNVFVIPLNGVSATRLQTEINQLAGVERVAATSALFGDHGDGWQTVRRDRSGGDSTQAHIFSVDANLTSVMGLSMIAGHNLPASASDSASRLVLINEEAVRSFHLGNAGAAIGQTIWLNDSTDVQIAGVLNDFKFTTLVWKISPLIMRYQPATFRYLTVKVASGNPEEVRSAIARVWKRVQPYEPFAGIWYDTFLNDRHSHTDDLAFLALLIGLALSIACLGLLGMVTYTMELRTKEVAVRKVMGARIDQVIWLLSWDFVKLLLIAGAIAIPLGYLASSLFLTTFAYHISVGASMLGLCFGALLLLGGLTIGFRTYRTAITNPADSLRTE